MRHTILNKPNLPRKVMTATGVTAVLLGVNQATISWTNPPANNYDTIYIERSVNAGAYVFAGNPVKGTTSFVDSPGNGVDTTYAVTPIRTGWSNGPTVISSMVRTMPAAPAIVNTLNRFDMGALSEQIGFTWNPQSGGYASWDADWEEAGSNVWHSIGTALAPDGTYAGGGSWVAYVTFYSAGYQFRVRGNAPGGGQGLYAVTGPIPQGP